MVGLGHLDRFPGKTPSRNQRDPRLVAALSQGISTDRLLEWRKDRLHRITTMELIFSL